MTCCIVAMVISLWYLHRFLTEYVAMSNADNLSSNSTNNFASKIHEVLEEIFVGRHFKFTFKTLANPKTNGHTRSGYSCSLVSKIKPLQSHTPSMDIIALLRQKLAHGMLKNVENSDQENSYSTQITPVYNDLLSNSLYCDESYTEQPLVQLDFSTSTPSIIIPCSSGTDNIMVNDNVVTSFEKDHCLGDVSFIPSTQFWRDFFQPDSPIPPSHSSLDNRQDHHQKEQNTVTMTTHKDGISHDLGYNEESIDPEIEMCLAIKLEKDWIASQKVDSSSSPVAIGSQVWTELSIGQVLSSTTSIASSCTPFNCTIINSGCGTYCSLDPSTSTSPDLFATTPQSHSFLSSPTATSLSFSGPDIFKSNVRSRDKRTTDEAAIAQITCGQRHTSTTSHKSRFKKPFESCDKMRFKWTSSTPVFSRQQVTKRKLMLLKQAIAPQQYDESHSITCQTSLSSFSPVNTPPSSHKSCSKTGFFPYNIKQTCTPHPSQGQNDFLTMESPDLI